MRNSILILFLVINVISCRRPHFRLDKIQFSDRQSLSEKKEIKNLVSQIFSQDTFRLNYSESSCSGAYFNGKIIGTASKDSLKLTYLEISAPDSNGRGFIFLPALGIDIYLSRLQEDSMQQLFTKYGNREYKMMSSGNQTYELVGSDTSFQIENNYSFEGNPLNKLEQLLELNKIKELAQARSVDSSALDIYWSDF